VQPGGQTVEVRYGLRRWIKCI